MNTEVLLNFLKTYAQNLKQDFDWSHGAPYTECLSMPGRYTGVKDNSGEVIATFHTKDLPSACPISSRDVSLAKILTEVLNQLSDLQSRAM